MLKRITCELDNLGMSNKIRGYAFCRSAIEKIASCGWEISIDSIYDFVAQKYNTNKSCVERNIRYAVERTWEVGDIDRIFDVFGYTVRNDKGKPTNSEFLFMLADRVNLTE